MPLEQTPDMEEAQRSRRGYDRLSRPYRWLETIVFGGQLQRARTQLLGQLSRPARALVLGDGDGRLLVEFARQYRETSILSIDQSCRMIRAQRRRMANVPDHNVTWVQADVRTLQLATRRFDVLIMPFFLDCFTEPELHESLPRWLGWATPTGSVLVIDFVVPPRGIAKWIGKAMLGVMHGFFRWQTGLPNRVLVDADAILRSLGWSVATSHTRYIGMIRSALYRPASVACSEPRSSPS
ncbi:MAG: class I SAM-dependent methyltransferase [Planctomycetota bacterium]